MTTVDIMSIQTPPSSVSIKTGVWGWSSQAGVPPATKQMRSDTADWQTATQLYLSDTDDGGNNRAPDLGTLKPGDLVRLEHNTDTTRFAVFNIVDAALAVTSGAYHTINVTLSEIGGVLPNNGTLIQVIFVQAGTFHVAPNHMLLDLTMVGEITESMCDDLMDYFCDYLQTVTHLVNHADIQANVGGVIITESEDIVPVVVGPPAPLPMEGV